jgi:ketosteroid isomerase-like protein
MMEDEPDLMPRRIEETATLPPLTGRLMMVFAFSESDPIGKESQPMVEHPNALLVHHCLQAASSGDRDTLRALWADDITWHVKGESPWHGEIKGADGIFDYLAELGELGPTGMHTQIEDILVSGERAAVLCHSTASRGEKSLEAGFMLVAQIVERRIQSITSIPIDARHVARFWQDD